MQSVCKPPLPPHSILPSLPSPSNFQQKLFASNSFVVLFLWFDQFGRPFVLLCSTFSFLSCVLFALFIYSLLFAFPFCFPEIICCSNGVPCSMPSMILAFYMDDESKGFQLYRFRTPYERILCIGRVINSIVTLRTQITEGAAEAKRLPTYVSTTPIVCFLYILGMVG